MPSLSRHQSSVTTKLLMIGDSGSGKTGSLVSLVKAGYNLRIIDLDNGLDVLKNLILDQCPDRIESVYYETCTDKFKNVNGRLIPQSATAWSKSAGLLDNFKGGKEEDGTKYSLGSITTWTEKEVLVIDSMTFLGQAAFRYILSLNGRLAGPYQQNDYFQAQNLVESMLQMLYDESVKCNVIVMSHITYIGSDDEAKGYPSALGKALSPKVGRYFNSLLQVKTTGSGSAQRQRIHTRPQIGIELKNPNPGKVKPFYELADGLAQYFTDVRTAVPEKAPADK